jgi:YgiT-type zinc finger domain-containing protein
MEKLHTHSNPAIHCRHCPAGVMRQQRITYFTWLGEELVTVPNFPAWVCDICGKREYDEQAVATLSMLLSPEAGNPSRRFKRATQPDSTKRNFTHPRTTDG